MTRKLAVLIITLLTRPYLLWSQGYNVTGTILDETDNSTLIGVSVMVHPVSDTTQKYGTVTDVDGNFSIANLPAGQYLFRASYIGFQNHTRNLNITEDINLGAIRLRVLSTQLQNVTISAEQIRAQQSGDTTSFNAGAFKTNPDASAEDLINKMPGISTEGGTIKAQGEEVRKVLVDGKPFFGDDPNAALKNLPAEIIDRIQVFDRLSDQAQLTGFDDGQGEKTINIVTKPGRNTGQFGKITAGYGARDEQLKDNLYLLGGNINIFKGDTRVSIIALSNNVNQQNFSTDDLMGVLSSSGGQSRGGGGSSRGGRGGTGGGGPRGGGGPGGGGRGGDAGNFLIGQQQGITTTHSVGLNYTDTWAKNIEVSGSYFFNSTTNENNNNLTRTYFTGPDSNLIYKESSATRSNNINHRANLRIEYEIDSSNKLIFTPRVSIQQNEYERQLSGESKLADSSLINSTENRNQSNNLGYNIGGNLVYRRKFDKKGRTASLSLSSQLNNRTGDGGQYSFNQYSIDTLPGSYTTTILDQRYDLNTVSSNHSANITYTEPLGAKSQLMINYNPSWSQSSSDRETRRKDGTDYTELDPNLSNKYDNTYNTQRGGLSYKYNNKEYNLNIGANYQHADLEGIQEYPVPVTIQKTFSNFLPSAMLNYKFTRTQNLRIMYRTNTNAPSISQLQNAPDISNPLLVRTGNPNLKQDYTHTLTLRYGNTNTTKSTSFFAMLYGSYVQDYIGNATTIPDTDIEIAEGIILNRGAQLSRPENLDGYYSLRSFLTYGMPVRPIKSNLNLNLGANMNRIPAIINNVTNYANNYTLNGGLVVSSNISENLDFTLSYSGNYNIVRNTIQTQADNNYYYQNTSLRLNWIFLGGFVFNTNVNHNLYTGLAEGFNQSFVLWNASFGYKFLKDRSLDIRLTAYDILNQNRAIERNVTDTYIEDSYTNVLRRYFMLNLTYTLRRFGGASTSDRDSD